MNKTETNEMPAFLKAGSKERKALKADKLPKAKPLSELIKVKTRGIDPTNVVKQKPISDFSKFATLYNHIEDMIDDGELAEDSAAVYKLLGGMGLKKTITEMLKEHFTKALDEFMGYKSPKLKEYFEDTPEIDIQRRIVAYTQVVDTLNSMLENRKAGRSTRKGKRGKVVKQVRNVNYRKVDPEYQIKSIEPAEIVGVKGLLTFNVKSKRVNLFVAEGDEGLDLKGTSMHQYNDKKSLAKALRKPEDILKELRQVKTVAQALKILKPIAGKAHGVRPRINSDVLLIKVLK